MSLERITAPSGPTQGAVVPPDAHPGQFSLIQNREMRQTLRLQFPPNNETLT
jgi:hypothetical protein